MPSLAKNTTFARWAGALSTLALVSAGLIAAGGWVVNDSADRAEVQATSLVVSHISAHQMLLGYHLKDILRAPEAPTFETKTLDNVGGTWVYAKVDGLNYRVSRTGGDWFSEEDPPELQHAAHNKPPEPGLVDKALNAAWGHPGERMDKVFRQAAHDIRFPYATVFYDDRAETTYSGLSPDICRQRLYVADQMGTPAAYAATTAGLALTPHKPGTSYDVKACDTVVVTVPK